MTSAHDGLIQDGAAPGIAGSGRRCALVFGDSHSNALAEAVQSGRAPADMDFEVFRSKAIKAGVPIGDIDIEEFAERVGALRPADVAVSVIGGNQHQTMGLIQHERSFDFLEPGGGGVRPREGVDIIPYAALFDTMRRHIRQGRDGPRMEQVRAAAKCPVVHVVGPPPKEHAEHILKNHETSYASAGILEKGVSPAPLRMKLWRLQVAVLEEVCADLGLVLLLPPPGTQTAAGFLQPAFYRNDATHANSEYGRRVLEQIASLRQDGPVPSTRAGAP